MTDLPAETVYHKLVGWHAPSLRRAVIVLAVGAVAVLALLLVAPWELAVIAGWDAAAVAFLATVWPIIRKASGETTATLASREDVNHRSAAGLLVTACVMSLLGVAFALGLAGTERGARQVLMIALAVVTVALSWSVVNTVYTLRYTHLDYRSANRIDFGDPAGGRPSYRDYAYIAFTVGMTYQVSDTTLRHPQIRRVVLGHATVSYVFGVVIVAGAINLIAGLVN